MTQLFDDLFHAQPDALFMVAGLLFIAIAVVGSIKTYIDPGKFGRIAAGVIGVILVVVGFRLYGNGSAATPAAAPSAPAATSVPGQPARAGNVPGAPVSTLCKFFEGPKAGTVQNFAGKFQPLRVGATCRDGQGSQGFVVALGTK